jgi:hypothetical protein
MLLVDRIEVVHPGSRSPHQIEGPVARKVNNRRHTAPIVQRGESYWLKGKEAMAETESR